MRKTSSRGFTLLEVMVSVGILGVIMVLVWSSTGQSIRSKDRVEARDLIFHQGQVALKKVADDIAVAFLTKSQTTGTAEGQAQSQLKTFFIGEDKGGQDALRFTSLSHMRLVRNSKESDQTRIAYEVVPHPEETRQFNLTRREEPWLTDNTEVGGRAFPLAERILRFELEYYDERKNDWGKEWNTDRAEYRDKLPMAVRITIVFADPEDENLEIPISTAVMPALWKSPIEF